MKYKLINQITKEEHLCDKVIIDGMDYYVSDENVVSPCYFYNKTTNYLGKSLKKEGAFWTCENIEGFHLLSEAKKVIATTNPNIDIPQILEEPNEILVHQIAADLGYRILPDDLEEGIKAGYKESQETHPFSEVDMSEFYEWCDTSEEASNFWKENIINIDMNGSHYKKIRENRKKLLEIWKEKRIKTFYFE